MSDICVEQDPFVVGTEQFSPEEVVKILRPFILPRRCERIETILAQRTYTVTPVVEGIYDRGNVNAVLRSAEGLGYQSVHIIDSSQRYKEANRVTQGADKWLDVHMWEDTPACVRHLKARGYRVLATHLDEQARPIDEIAFDTPTALVFGNEKEGVSDTLLSLADERVVLPMAGFSQSFNISVAAALCLYHVQQDRCRRLGAQGDLSPEALERVKASYYMRSVMHAERILLQARI